MVQKCLDIYKYTTKEYSDSNLTLDLLKCLIYFTVDHKKCSANVVQNEIKALKFCNLLRHRKTCLSVNARTIV